jgi:hypothetical protein
LIRPGYGERNMETFRDWLQVTDRSAARFRAEVIDAILSNFVSANGADDRSVLERTISTNPGMKNEVETIFEAWKGEQGQPDDASGALAGERPQQQTPGSKWPEKDKKDALGLTVRRIYIRTDLFAIYSAEDDEDHQDICGLRYYLHGDYEACKARRKRLISLAPQIAYITDAVCSMRPFFRSPKSSVMQDRQAFRERIFELVAQAMSAALEECTEEAQRILEQTRACVDERRDSMNRMRYVVANTVSAGLILLLGSALYLSNALGDLLPKMVVTDNKVAVVVVLMAGALGAFFSVAVALNDVKVRWSITLSEMFYAGSVRIPVGVIAAAAVTWLVEGGWILNAVKPEYLAASVLLFGFLAGFSERFVPNALKQVEEQAHAKMPGSTTDR